MSDIKVGVGNLAKQLDTLKVGVNGVAKKVKKVFVGVNNQAKLAYSDEPDRVVFKLKRAVLQTAKVNADGTISYAYVTDNYNDVIKHGKIEIGTNYLRIVADSGYQVYVYLTVQFVMKDGRVIDAYALINGREGTVVVDTTFRIGVDRWQGSATSKWGNFNCWMFNGGAVNWQSGEYESDVDHRYTMTVDTYSKGSYSTDYTGTFNYMAISSVTRDAGAIGACYYNQVKLNSLTYNGVQLPVTYLGV